MKIMVDEKKRMADMVKNCREAREEEENVKILVERKTIQKAFALLIASDIDCDPALRIEAECLLRRILDNASPEGHITGEQKRVTMEDGDYIFEWDGSQWFKKWHIIKVTKYNATCSWQGEERVPVLPEIEPPGEPKESNTPYFTHTHEKLGQLYDLQYENKCAIVEILDMLIQYGSAIGRAKSTNDCDLHVRAESLKAKLGTNNDFS